MNLRQLEYLIAIAEDGSFRAAAHRLHVAAPSISQQIRLLELEVGGPLLERLPRGARLTSAGRAFLPEARSALLAAQRAQRAGRAALTLELAEIEIATVFSLAVGLLPAAIQRMCDAHPGISVQLHEFAHRDLLEDAVDAGVGRRRGRADAAARAARPRRLPRPRVVRRDRSDGGTAAFASPGPIRLASLADDDWILFPATHGLRGVVLAICASAGFAPRDVDAGRPRSRPLRGSRPPASASRSCRPTSCRPTSTQHVRVTDPPIFRKLGAYTRVEWSPQADALIAALLAGPWVAPPADAFILA